MTDLQDVKTKLQGRVTFEAVAECKEDMTYLWHRRGKHWQEWQEVPQGSKYKGQGTPSLVVEDVDEKDEGVFHCVVSSEGGHITTRDASLKIC